MSSSEFKLLTLFVFGGGIVTTSSEVLTSSNGTFFQLSK
jgi:hypothetical protein